MEIQGPGGISGPEPIRPNRFHASRPNIPVEPISTDKVEISDIARFKALLAKIPDIRADRVAELRARIESGTYETEDKFEVLVERLLDELS